MVDGFGNNYFDWTIYSPPKSQTNVMSSNLESPNVLWQTKVYIMVCLIDIWLFFLVSSISNMSSDLKMAPNDKRDSRFHDNRKNSPDSWGKSPPRHGGDATTETNRNDPHSIRCRVFIGNLPVEMKSKELEDTFAKYGRVTGVSVHNNYGFVQFEDDNSADAAVEKENRQVYYGKHVGEWWLSEEQLLHVHQDFFRIEGHWLKYVCG